MHCNMQQDIFKLPMNIYKFMVTNVIMAADLHTSAIQETCSHKHVNL